MPAASTYLNPNDKYRDSARTDYGTFSMGERSERQREYNKTREYYQGRQKTFLSRMPGEPDDNTIINLVRVAIDRTISFLFPSVPKLVLLPAREEEDVDEQWLKRTWHQNGGVALLQDIALNGSFGGHCYVRVRPPRDDELYPTIVNLDPSQVTTYWASDDISRVQWHEVYWKQEDDRGVAEYLQDFVFEDPYWSIIRYQRRNRSGWVRLGMSTWPYLIGPIVHWKHFLNPNQFYGRSEASGIPLQDSVNLAVSEMQRINRYHASPKTVGTGFNASDVNEVGAINQMFTVPAADAKIYNLEMDSDLSFSTGLVEILRDSFLSESGVTILRGDIKDFQRVTNAGIRTFFMDMLSKNSVLQHHYGKGIQDISRLLFMVAGMGDKDVEVQHVDPLPVDVTEAINALVLERNMGVVSRETVSTRRGYVWHDELERQQREHEYEVFAPQQMEQSQEPNPEKSVDK